MKVWVDDLRNDQAKADIIFRDARLAWKYAPWKEVTQLWLDHDLGEGKWTGYDLLYALHEHGLIPERVILVTSNPVGRERFIHILELNGYRMFFDEENDYDETWVRRVQN